MVEKLSAAFSDRPVYDRPISGTRFVIVKCEVFLQGLSKVNAQRHHYASQVDSGPELFRLAMHSVMMRSQLSNGVGETYSSTSANSVPPSQSSFVFVIETRRVWMKSIATGACLLGQASW